MAINRSLGSSNIWKRSLFKNVMDLNGDSRAIQAWVSAVNPTAGVRPVGLQNISYINWANVLTGNRMRLGSCFAQSGYRSDQYITTYRAARMASNSGWSLWNYPIVNDLAQAVAGYTDLITGVSVTLANVADVAFTNLKAEWEADLGQGKRVVLLTEPGANNLTPAQIVAMHDFNMKIKSYADGKWGVKLFDFTPILWQASGSASAIVMKAGYLQTGDPTHYSSLGAYNVGKVFGTWLASILNARDRNVVALHDIYQTNPHQLDRNPLLTFLTGGTLGANVTLSSGTIPANQTLAASAAATVAITSSDVVSGDTASGKNVSMAVTAGPAATVVRIGGDSPAANYWTVSSIIEGGMQVDVAANAGGAHVYLQNQINTNAGTLDEWCMYGTRAQGPGPTEAYTMDLKSEPDAGTSITGSTTTGYTAPFLCVSLDASQTVTVTYRRKWGNLRYPMPAF